MVKLTLIARSRDGLPLAEGLDADKEHEMYSYKSQAKVRGRRRQVVAGCMPHRAPPGASLAHRPLAAAAPAPPQGLFKKIATSPTRPPPRMSLESGRFTFHYLISQAGVVHLTLVEKAYPKKLAFQYLEELDKEFTSLYGTQIEGVTRPYAFIKFGALEGRTRSLPDACPAWHCGTRSTAGAPPERLHESRRPRRHLHPEDQEAVPGHPHAAQHRAPQRGYRGGALDHDAQHPGRAGAGGEARP